MPLIGNNTGEVRPFTAIQLVEEACSRAGIPPSKLTSEIVEKSPLSAANYSFVFDDKDVSRALLYDLVKANSEFTGSSDV